MNDGSNWIPITETENIPSRQGRAVCIDGRDIAIFNVNGRFLTIDNRCPHKGGPLSDGIVAGTTVVCPLHGWRFDLESGLASRATAPACVTTFPTRVEEGIIFVDLEAGMRVQEEIETEDLEVGLETEKASV